MNYANKVLVENFSKYCKKSTSNSLIANLNSSRFLATETNELQEKVLSDMTIMRLISVEEFNENDNPSEGLIKLF